MVSLRPSHAVTYGRVARLLVEHFRPWMLGNGTPPGDDEARDRAKRLACDLEDLGPTFVKFGQLLATRADVLPAAYVEQLSRLHAEVEPADPELVSRVVSNELGAPIDTLFASFEPRPLGSASLSQVHAATLRDGRPVAVKVQRPGIADSAKDDLAALRELADFVDRHTELGRRIGFADMVEQFTMSMERELDFRREAAQLVRLAANIDEPEIVVPTPVEDYTTSRVLTMELVHGAHLDRLSGAVLVDVDGARLADALFRSYLRQILVDGFVHADPHPGNVMLTRDHRLALIDVGMVVRIDPRVRDRLMKMLLAVAKGDTDRAAVAAAELGTPLDSFHEERFRRGVAQLVGYVVDTRPGDVAAGRLLFDVARVAGEAGLRPPAELTLLARTLSNLDAVGRLLDPEFDSIAAVERHSVELMTARIVDSMSPHGMMATVLEAKELVEELPGRMNRILESLAGEGLRFDVRLSEEREWRRALHHMASRLTIAIVLASLVVGAALLMRVETDQTLFGYPALAMVCFLAATIGGFALAGMIFLESRRTKHPD